MTKKTRYYYIGAAALIVFAIVDALVNKDKPEKEPVTETKIEAKAEEKLDRSKVYVIAKQFAKDHLGSADFGFGDDGFTDYGDSVYHVTGIADIPGKRYRWTVEIKYNGGQWSDRNNWTLKGYTDY